MYIYGLGGLSSEVTDILEDLSIQIDGYIVDEKFLTNEDIIRCKKQGLRIYTSIEGKQPIVLAIGNNKARKFIVSKSKIKSKSIVHPSVIKSKNVFVDEGTILEQGGVIQVGCVIGKFCILNNSVSVGHDCKIGNFVHIAPNVTLCGNVVVGDESWIGAGAVVIQKVRIGKGCIIGAGAVVTKDIPDGYLAYGNPCRLVRKTNEDDFCIKKNISSAYEESSSK